MTQLLHDRSLLHSGFEAKLIVYELTLVRKGIPTAVLQELRFLQCCLFYMNYITDASISVSCTQWLLEQFSAHRYRVMVYFMISSSWSDVCNFYVALPDCVPNNKECFKSESLWQWCYENNRFLGHYPYPNLIIKTVF